MALSEQGANLIVGSLNAVGTYFSTKGVASEAKKTEAARRKLLELQAEEQRIRNQAARMSLGDQDARLPFAVSGPSLPSDAFDGGIRPTNSAPIAPGSPPMAASGGVLLIGGLVVGLAALSMVKARA